MPLLASKEGSSVVLIVFHGHGAPDPIIGISFLDFPLLIHQRVRKNFLLLVVGFFAPITQSWRIFCGKGFRISTRVSQYPIKCQPHVPTQDKTLIRLMARTSSAIMGTLFLLDTHIQLLSSIHSFIHSSLTTCSFSFPLDHSRRLVDMLKENEDVISFFPGIVTEGETTLGRIEVHDRLKVESSILPRYFNHSSFASLRRQLNYFCFIRMGKGRQRGATYCNDGVIVMDDILRLKRRSTPVGSSTPSPPAVATPSTGKRERSLPQLQQVNTPSDDDEITRSNSQLQTRPAKKARPTIISPRSSPVFETEESSEEGQAEPQGRRISLDLTLPNAHALAQPYLATPSPHQQQGAILPVVQLGEDDVLAGCRALLSFSRSSNCELVA